MHECDIASPKFYFFLVKISTSARWVLITVVRTLFVQIHQEVSLALASQVSLEMACLAQVSFQNNIDLVCDLHFELCLWKTKKN